MIRDMNGNIVPFGKTHRKIEETFMFSTTLPSWLTVTGTGATSSIVLPHTDYGYLQVNTGATANNVSTLNILPSGIDMTKCKEIILEIDSFVTSENEDHMELYFNMNNGAGNKGISLITQKSVNATLPFVKVRPSNALQPINYNIIQGSEYNRRKNIVIRLRSDKTYVLMECDNVVFEYAIPAENIDIDAILLPQIAIKTLANEANYFRLSRVAISIIHN